MKVFALIALILFSTVTFAQAVSDNADLTSLFTTDQAARQGNNIDWAKLRLEDDKREIELHRMLDAGQVRTANDFFHAALIFQHGQHQEDFLLAHVLADNAASLGAKGARWLSAATLDRYLLAVSQPQIFGTQFESTIGKPGTYTQRTMDPTLISDSMRALSCVVSLAEQKKILDKVNHGGAFGSTHVPNCE